MTKEECTSGHIYYPDLYMYGFMTQDEQYCVADCPLWQEPVNDQCRCKEGFTPSADLASCTCENYLSLDKQSCVTECEYPTVPNEEKQCVRCSDINPDTPLYAEGVGCTDTCPDTAPVKGIDYVCESCPEDTPFWDPVIAMCVAECD